MRLIRNTIVGVCVACAGALGSAQIGVADTNTDKPYTVIDGKVDRGTYNGYRRYHSTCHVCHGPDAMGSSFAPALKESLKTMPFETFLSTVVNGRQAQVAGGQPSVMPSFAADKDTMLYINDIYSYLKARADGVLPPGRPTRIPKK